MELRHLRYFNEIANELSFSRAATKLHIAQPALSARMRDLEEELGTKLFRRLGSGIALTAAGEVFHGHVRQLLDDLGHAIRLTQRVEHPTDVTIAVGFVGSASYSFLPWVLREFARQHGDVTLKLSEMSGPRQVEELLHGNLDVGFLRLPIHNPAILVEVIHREPFIVALPSTHPLATRTKVRVSDLTSETFVLFPPGESAGFHQQVVMLCQQAGFAPRVGQYAAPMQNVIGLVGAGLGISIVPRSVAKITMPEVTYRPLSGSEIQAETALAWRRGHQASTLDAFLAIARSVAGRVQPTS